ncbi:MAG: hypothetical protein OJF50_000267 [Nitrospira sp.]|nr:hypothetical protein [Nitrospira sp.]
MMSPRWLVKAAVTWSVAYGGYAYVMDTVVAVTESQIQVKTNEGRIVSLRVMPNRTCRGHGIGMSSSTGTVGDRVIIEVRESGPEPASGEIRCTSA